MGEYDQIQLTANWRLGEFLVSRDFPALAASMRPDERQKNNLFLLAVLLLQPLRNHFGIWQSITSGLRINGLNGLVGGSTTSLHPEGLAADIHPYHPPDLPLLPDMFKYVRDELRGRWAECKYDERKMILHLGLWQFGKEPFCQKVNMDGSIERFRV